MENEKRLNNEELEQVNGGSSNIENYYVHADCGARVTVEDSGIYHADVWLTCPKCGKTWHPHNWSKVGSCEGILSVTRGSF